MYKESNITSLKAEVKEAHERMINGSEYLAEAREERLEMIQEIFLIDQEIMELQNGLDELVNLESISNLLEKGFVFY